MSCKFVNEPLILHVCISLYNKGFVWFPRRCLSRMIPCSGVQVSLAHSRNEKGKTNSFSALIGLSKSIDI